MSEKIFGLNQDRVDKLFQNDHSNKRPFITDIAEDIYQHTQSLEKAVFRDSLTGCYNKNAWEDFQKHFDLNRGDKATILIFDLNGLKDVNDTLGHLAGDNYIKNTATYIQEVFSRKGDKVYRFGGDELAIVVPYLKENQREEFKTFVQSFFNHEVLSQKGLDFAYGIAHTDAQKDSSIKDTIQRADSAMYQNKTEWKTKHPEKYSRK